MQVVTLRTAIKEAAKLNATEDFQSAIKVLTRRSWDHVLRTMIVRQLKWRDINDVYEVRHTKYRTAFLIRSGTTAYIFGFFKKQGDQLKDSELRVIKARAAELRKIV